MANNFYCRTALIGGASGALDEIDGAGLNDLDFAIVSILNIAYFYTLDDDSAAAESSPEVISPDANAGNKRWILQNVVTNTGTASAPSLQFGNDAIGIFQQATNFLGITIAGTQRFNITSSAIQGILSGAAMLKNIVATATVASLIPNNSDEDSGLGGAGGDTISLIAGAVEGIRVTEVAGVINVLNDGFTKLGSGAPTIKMKKVTGTTGATEGTSTFIAHGLTQSKILSFQVFITSTDLIPPFFTAIAEFQYDVYLESPNVVIMLHSTNSGNLLSKAITVLITYEE
ncbi:hypothetical protein LCGC14_1459710 [marine sediment metagenome]|uniref:Uncharacterized protein n=1 Tax=marine sediment metagenome TaxID=412755 RepID=A0A0F9JFE9_9ZZZZ